MYVKTSVRKRKHGEVRYLQLAHNEWDPAARRSVPKIVYNFGREDQLDTDAVRRLVASLSRLLDPGDALAATADGELVFTQSRPFGGAYVLDALWQRLGIGKILAGLASSGRGRPRDVQAAERVLFGLVASRALAPSSKLAASEWMSRDVHIDGLGEVSDDACYRAMDWLHAVRGELETQVYFSVADLLSLEVDLLFFDTTSTYFELEEADGEVARNWRGEKTAAGSQDADPDKTAGLRTHGKSKDSRDDLPQIVIGLAVTRDGIPVRCWCWPGSTSDSALIRQVKQDMRDWVLGKVIWVADRGFSSATNRRFLQQGAGGYLIGEKLRSASPLVKAALSRQGRYQVVAGNLQVKEVRLDDAPDRLVICYNPDAARRDAAVRADLIARLQEAIAASDKLTATKRAELRGKISTMPGLNRFLRVTPGGLLRIDKTKAHRRSQPGRQVPAALRRPAPVRRRHRPGLQAAAAGRARLAGHEVRPGPASRLPPARRTHPRPRHPVLARPAAGPRRREHHRPDLERHAPRARPHPPGHLHRPRRHLQAAHRAHQARPRPARQARHPTAPQDPPTHPPHLRDRPASATRT